MYWKTEDSVAVKRDLYAVLYSALTKFSLHLSLAGEPYSEKLKVTSLELQRYSKRSESFRQPVSSCDWRAKG